MARTPADATRFTATGPYASSSTSTSTPAPAPSGRQIQFSAPAPANETPQQKIARLRLAAAQTKRGPESRYDKTVRIGRHVADSAHRITALGLIGATVLTAMVATAGISDMILHNRRRRNEWLAQKRAEEAREVAVARLAVDEGSASEEQVLLVNRERAKMEAAEAKRNRPGVWRRATGWLVGDLSGVETKGGKLGVGAEREEGGVLRAVEETVQAGRGKGEEVDEVYTPLGGPLDREAERSVNKAADVGKSWIGWLRGR